MPGLKQERAARIVDSARGGALPKSAAQIVATAALGLALSVLFSALFPLNDEGALASTLANAWFFAALAAAFLLAGLLLRVVASDRVRLTLRSTALSAALVLCLFGHAAAVLQLWEYAPAVASIGSGALFGFEVLSLFSLLSELSKDAKEAFSCFVTSMVVGIVLLACGFVARPLPRLVAVPLFLALAAVACLFLTHAVRRAGVVRSPRSRETRLSGKVSLVLGSLGLCTGYLVAIAFFGGAPGEFAPLPWLCPLLAGVAMLVYVAFFRRHYDQAFSLASIMSLLTPPLTLFILLVPLVPVYVRPLFACFAALGWLAVAANNYMWLVILSKLFSASVSAYISSSRIFSALGLAVGAALGTALNNGGAPQMTLLIVGIVLVVVLSASGILMVGYKAGTPIETSVVLDPQAQEPFERKIAEEPGFEKRESLFAAYCKLTEREVYSLLLRGQQADEISGELFISRNTVKTHIASIYRKAGAHSAQELTKLVLAFDKDSSED